MKKLIVFFSVMLAVLSVSSLGVNAASDYTVSGTVFTVYTAKGLMDVAAKINSDTAYSSYGITLANDIDMSGKSWVPIGKDATYAYKGTFNGAGKTLSNLTATGYTSQNLALVGVAGNGATVKDVHLKNVNFSSTTRGVSGIIANVTATATVSGCTVEGKIHSGENYAGGLVALVSSKSSRLTVSNCAVNADISSVNHSAAGIVGGDTATGQTTKDINTYPAVTASKVYVTGNFSAVNRVSSLMGYAAAANLSFTDCVSTATLKYSKASENGAFIAMDNYSKIYLENCIVFSDLHAFYNLNMTASLHTVEFKNCYLLKDKIGKAATIATYNQNGYYKYDASATYKYTVIADVIVDGVGPAFTPFTEANTSYRVPIIQYNLPSGKEDEVLDKAYTKAYSMFASGSKQRSFVHKHAWASGEVETAATYLSTGITAHKCTSCHAVKRVETPCLESNVTWSYNDSTKTLTISGSGSMGQFHTPNTMLWKELRNKVKTVVIKSGVEDICDYAFYDFTKLESITIPSGIKMIGAYAFHNCKSLEKITLPSSVTTVRDHAFEYCSSLKSINIPKSVTSVGYGVFRYAKDATPVITSSSSKYTVAGNCLIDTANLTVIAGFKNSTIPTDSAKVTTIGRSAFQGVNIANVTIPSNVTTLAVHAFADGGELKTAAISQNVTVINEGVFYGCYKLDNVVLPKNTETIAALAFNECTGLKTVTLPASLKTIDIAAFKNCLSLTKAAYTGTSEQWGSVSVAGGNDILKSKATYGNAYPTVMSNAVPADYKVLDAKDIESDAHITNKFVCSNDEMTKKKRV